MTRPKKDIQVETKGYPSLSTIDKNDFDIFISALELEIRNYYKDKKKTKNQPP